MTLADVVPGSLVVIVEKGDEVMVQLGNLLGAHKGRKSKLTTWWGAMVRTIDDQSLDPGPSMPRIVDPALEVVAVIISAEHLRTLRAMNRRHHIDSRDAAVDLDPIAPWTRGARAPGEAF